MRKKLILKTVVQIALIFLICSQYGCVISKHKYQAYQDMKEFVLNEYNRLGLGIFLFFDTKDNNKKTYITTEDLQIALVRSSNLNELYLKDLMMGKIILSCVDFGECITLSSNIIDDYKKKSFEEFTKIYTKRVVKKLIDAQNEPIVTSYIINSDLNQNEKLSVAYFLYLNNIYTVIDGYSFDYFGRKVPLYFPAKPINMEEHLIIEE